MTYKKSVKPQICIKVSPFLLMLCKDAAAHNDRDMANWIRLNLEREARKQLKRGKS